MGLSKQEEVAMAMLKPTVLTAKAAMTLHHQRRQHSMTSRKRMATLHNDRWWHFVEGASASFWPEDPGQHGVGADFAYLGKKTWMLVCMSEA
jgi:hypothetical protein